MDGKGVVRHAKGVMRVVKRDGTGATWLWGCEGAPSKRGDQL